MRKRRAADPGNRGVSRVGARLQRRERVALINEAESSNWREEQLGLLLRLVHAWVVVVGLQGSGEQRSTTS